MLAFRIRDWVIASVVSLSAGTAAWLWSDALQKSGRGALALAASVLAGIVVSWSTRVNARLDGELDRLEDLDNDVREALSRYIATHRGAITESAAVGAVGAALAPAAIVIYLLGQSTDSQFERFAGALCAALIVVLGVHLVRLAKYVGSLDQFHEQISNERRQQKLRQESRAELARQKAREDELLGR
jgi:hypothetical protein